MGAVSDLSPTLADDAQGDAPALGGVKAAEQDGYLFDPAIYQIEGLPPPERWAHLTADQARTMRATITIAQGNHPMGGNLREPAGETCGSCCRCVAVQYNKTYYKCDLCRATWTKGPGSDIRKKWPACERWEPKK